MSEYYRYEEEPASALTGKKSSPWSDRIRRTAGQIGRLLKAQIRLRLVRMVVSV